MKHRADIFPLSYFWFQVICVKTSQLAGFIYEQNQQSRQKLTEKEEQ